MYSQPEKRRGSTSAHSATFYTILCFALAGLIAGFAIGGFAQHLSYGSSTGPGSLSNSAPALTGHSPNLTTTPTQENVFVGQPVLAAGDYSNPQQADGTTDYQVNTQIVNKADKTPITVTDVTCRLWLTNDLQATMAGLSANDYALPKNPSLFNQPFPSEMQGALNFTAPSTQTQPCAANGKTKWTYTLSNSVPGGTYYLGILTDWKGIHYNWYMVAISVHNANSENSGDNGNNGNAGDNGGGI